MADAKTEEVIIPIPSQAVTPWYLDKALYITVLSMVLPLLALFGLHLDPEKIATFLLSLVSFASTVYVIAHKVKSGAVLIAEIKARALAAVSVDPSPTPQSAAAALNSLAPK